MSKKILKKILPDHNTIKKQKFLKIFGKALYKKEIWSLSRKRVLIGAFIGIFVACLPMPLQMVLSTFLAIMLGGNLPISFILLFINNPFTIPPLFYLEYKIGELLFEPKEKIEFDFDSMMENFDQIALLLWSGSIVLGLVLATLSVIVLNFLWIYNIKRLRKRDKN